MFKSRPSGGMLGSVGAKIAHTSIMPGLGNQDLRTLQELITAEKGVLLGVQRLAGDVAKGAEALKNWGMGEGDDLGDVLAHSTNLLAEFSAALTQFASYEERIRLQLKSIRTREENLDEMKRRKRTVDNKADSADKKLAKMGDEHKGRMGQVELLNELKQEGRQLEIDIVKEEAGIGDYKRRTTRELMGLKFAGLAELAEKTTIIGDLGKLMTEEISLQVTQPGHPRAPYTRRQKTAELATEAKRCIDRVRLNVSELPESGPAPVDQDPYDLGYDVGAHINHGNESSADPYSEFGQGSGFSGGSMRIGDDGSRMGDVPSSHYNTFPSRNASHFGVGPPTLGQSANDPEPTFSSSIADALAHDPTFNEPDPGPPPAPSHIQPSANSVHQPSVPSGTFAPPAGPPPGPVHQPSDSYFSRALPDPHANAGSPLPTPAIPAMEPSPWATAPSSPSKSRPLPIVNAQPAPQAPPKPSHVPEDQGDSDLAYARDETPASPTRKAYRRQNSGEFNYPYSDEAFYVRNHAASSRPLHNNTPPPEPIPKSDRGDDQEEVTSAAYREVSREMDALSMAPYASSPPRPAPSSSYGTPSEFPNQLPNPYASPPAPRSPVPTLPPLAPVPAISTPPQLNSPTATTRTIPASAFRRNMSRQDTLESGGGIAGSTSPLSVRKKVLGENTSRGPSPGPISPGAPPVYAPVDPEGAIGFGTVRERSMSPTAADRKGPGAYS